MRGCSSVVEHELPKLVTGVRFPPPALHCLFAILLSGCIQYVEPTSVGRVDSGGLYHTVALGETLWRIADRYGVLVEELARANRIADASKIEVGERLVIPSGGERRVFPPSGQMEESFVWPVQGRVISAFGMKQEAARNKGINVQAPAGTEVVAARSGEVSFVHEGLPGFGKTIILDHGDEFATVYAHLGQILVKKDERVSQRQIIGRVGVTGRTSVAALHFEIRRRQKPQNPFYYLP